MQAPMSMCLICRNEEATLENCLKSIRPYVAEIVVVDTGSTDKSPEIAKRYADKWETFTACNDEQGIFDFSMARNRSFELASYDIISWMDGDDEIVGAENFSKYIERLKGIPNPHFVQFPYEYSYDANGNCSLRHYRERLFFKTRGNFHWVNPVHEVSIPKPQSNQPFSNETADDIIWKHKRQFVNKIIQPNRNLRILKKWYDQHGDSDARQLYYLGLEYGNVGDVESSKKFLNRYLELSGWPDECYMALLRLMEYGFSTGDYEYVVDTAFRAVKIKPDWGEAYFNCSKAHYFLANSGKNEAENWKKCIDYARIGLSLPETKTLLFVNPNERNVEIHKYLNLALSKVGRIEEAINSINSALRFDPENKDLLLNKKIFEDYQMRDKTVQSLEALQRQGVISPESKEKIFAILANTINDAPKIEETKPAEITAGKKEENGMNWNPYHRPEGYPRGTTEKDQPVAVITPHSQAWGIPESFVYDDLPLKMTDAQLQTLVFIVWQQFALHDEFVSAISFLENAPYRVRHTNQTEDLLRKTKKMVAWIKDDAAYDKGNTPALSDGSFLTTEMTPLPGTLNGSALMRYQWMVDRIPNKNDSVLVLACIDGQESNRIGLAGQKRIVGVDMCSNSIKIANQKAEEFKTNAIHIQSYFDKMTEKLNGEKFDVVMAGDVYEHLFDPTNDMLVHARANVKDTGRMLMTTPAGSWTRGQVVPDMHPFLWANEGKHWLCDENRGHITAPTVWTAAANFRKAGWYVRNCTYVPQWRQQAAGQGNICVEAFATPFAKNDSPKDIVFYVGASLEEVTPHKVDCNGTGGSELMAIEMSKRLSLQGHRVRMYIDCGKDNEGIFDGVEYRQTDKFHDLSCDVLVVSRQAHALDKAFNVSAKVKVLWVHDLFPQNFNEEIYGQLDVIFALSNWHKNYMQSLFPFIKDDKLVLTQNGLNLEHFTEKIVPRNQFKAICCSSPDRYLPSLLSCWKEIKAQVPEAEVHLFYGFFNWRRSAELAGKHDQLRLIAELEQQIKDMEPLGVKLRGRIPQQDLAKEFLSSGVWLYPNWFQETSCISAMNAQAGGTLMITSPIAALNETAGDRATMIQGDWMSEEYRREFIKAAVSEMKNPDQNKRKQLQKYATEHFDINMVVQQWEKLFESKINKMPREEIIKKSIVLKPYVPLMDRK